MELILRVVVSGAQGFAGRCLVETAAGRGMFVHALSRSAPMAPVSGVDYTAIGEKNDAYEAWNCEADVFIHLAGRAHILRETAADPLTAFRKANVDATLAAARRAAKLGVKRFIFVSSIGVHGNTSGDHPVSANSTLRPHAAYAVSKLAAEEQLREFEKASGVDVIVVRPPLMYGPGVSANFLRLIRLVEVGMPLPFGKIKNRRSFLGVRNFVDFVLYLASCERLREKVFVPADREITSTPELVSDIARHMGRNVRLLPVPLIMLRLSSSLLGKRSLYAQLCDSLYVDMDVLRRTSGWVPPFQQNDLLKETVNWYYTNKGGAA